MRNRSIFLMFLFGLGSQLQIAASLSFSELFVLIAAPCWFSSEWPVMRRTGAHVFFIWALLVLFGGVMSYITYGAPFYFALRRFAVLVVIPCAIVVVHRILRKNMPFVGWYLLGGALSGILCTFVFQKSVEVTTYADGERGGRSAQDIMRGPVYWLHRISAFATLAYKGWYLKFPTVICVLLPLVMAAFGITQSSSGRGPAIGYLCASLIMLIGGKKMSGMRRMSKHIYLMAIIGLCVIFAFHKGYGYMARNGMLGEQTAKKYSGQTKRGSGMIDLLIGGRAESFVCFYALKDSPLLGMGLAPYDTKGYAREFLDKYSAMEDVVQYYNNQFANSRKGIVEELYFIPAHSQIGSFWLFYGIFGLFFWLYIIFVLVRYMKQDAFAIPQWYGWLAAAVPAVFWDMMFNPFAGRIGTPMFVVACLFARAVRLGRLRLPNDMIQEIQKHSL